MERIIAKLDSRVPSAMPDLQSLLSQQIDRKIAELFEDLDYLVQNANVHGSPEAALKYIQFYKSSVEDKFPAVVQARGTRAWLAAFDEAYAAYQPKVELADIKGWRKRAAKLATEKDEHKVVTVWREIFKQLEPVHELARDAVCQLDMDADAMLD